MPNPNEYKYILVDLLDESKPVPFFTPGDTIGFPPAADLYPEDALLKCAELLLLNLTDPKDELPRTRKTDVGELARRLSAGYITGFTLNSLLLVRKGPLEIRTDKGKRHKSHGWLGRISVSQIVPVFGKVDDSCGFVATVETKNNGEFRVGPYSSGYVIGDAHYPNIKDAINRVGPISDGAYSGGGVGSKAPTKVILP